MEIIHDAEGRIAGIAAQCPLFSGVPDPASLIEGLGSPEKYRKGETVCAPELFRRGLGIVCTGELSITTEDADGKHVPLNRLVPLRIFGASTVFHPAERFPTTITAATVCELLFLAEPQLELLFRQEFRIAQNYIAMLAQRIGFLNRKIDAFTAGSTESKLLRFFADNQSADGTVALSGSYTSLAKQLDIGRASLYRALDSLERQGIVRRGEGVLSVDASSLADEK